VDDKISAFSGSYQIFVEARIARDNDSTVV